MTQLIAAVLAIAALLYLSNTVTEYDLAEWVRRVWRKVRGS